MKTLLHAITSNSYWALPLHLSLSFQNAVLIGLDWMKDESEKQSTGSSLTAAQKREIEDLVWEKVEEVLETFDSRLDEMLDQYDESQQTRKGWWRK